MLSINLSVFSFIMVSVMLGCLAIVAAYYCRAQLRQRFARMEDTLRLYNTANVAIGRHMATLENELQELRKPTMAPAAQGSTVARTGARRSMRAASGHAEFSDAEMRLAQRLKSHLGSLRPN